MSVADEPEMQAPRSAVGGERLRDDAIAPR